jgi:hypothetical protein
MDVWNCARPRRWILLAAGLQLMIGTSALADPLYTAIDLGPGNPTFGNGTVTGSNGQTYAFNPVQNYLPAQWQNTTQGVPIVDPAPVNSPFTNGDPNYAYSYSDMIAMNSQGLGVGINHWGVDGQLENTEAFVTQLQPNGTWGTPTQMWAGTTEYAIGQSLLGIDGITSNGLVLGTGIPPTGATGTTDYDVRLLLYDTKTNTVTNLNNLVTSLTPPGQSLPWLLNGPIGQLDNDGRILVQIQSVSGQSDELLLVPQGVSAAPLATPEPATWAIFATMIGGCAAYQRLHTRKQVQITLPV